MRHRKRCAKHGFTAIELLVSIAVVTVLLALFLPAVSAVRESARRVECTNRLRNVAVGILSLEQTKGMFPAASVRGRYPNGETLDRRNWVVDVLPYLEQKNVADHWLTEESRTHPANVALAQTHIMSLVCPSDISATGGGDLSFVLNGGIGSWARNMEGGCDAVADSDFQTVDLNGDGIWCHPIADFPPDLVIHFQLALFFIAAEVDGSARTPRTPLNLRHYSIAHVTDGASNTMLGTENIRTGADPEILSNNWSSSDPRRTLFHFSSSICRERTCTDENVDLAAANSGVAGINAGRNKAEGESPHPSSFHTGGVNIAFVDGSVKFVSEKLDGRVYFCLFSPQGNKLQGTSLDGGIVGSNF